MKKQIFTLTFLAMLMMVNCAQSTGTKTDVISSLYYLSLHPRGLTVDQNDCFTAVNLMNSCIGSTMDNYKAYDICETSKVSTNAGKNAKAYSTFKTCVSTKINETACNLTPNKAYVKAQGNSIFSACNVVDAAATATSVTKIF
jgi:hypothetical protein